MVDRLDDRVGIQKGLGRFEHSEGPSSWNVEILPHEDQLKQLGMFGTERRLRGMEHNGCFQVLERLPHVFSLAPEVRTRNSG